MADQDPYEFTDPNKGYMAPGQRTAMTDYAKAMLYGKSQQPVHHWAQGVSNMVNALMGGRMLANAGERERNFDIYRSGTDAGRVFQGPGGSPPGPTQPEGQASPEPQPQQSLTPQALVPGSVSSPGSGPSSQLPDSPWPGEKTVNSLHPEFKPRINQLVDVLKNRYGLEAGIGEGYRTPERQAQLYAQGRTAPGPVVTYAGPNSSYHQFGSAADLTPKNMSEKQAAFVLKRALNENPQLGLKGFGDWDPFHVQLNQPLGALRQQGFRPSVSQNAIPSEAQSVARALNPTAGSNEPPAAAETSPAEASAPKVTSGGQGPIPGTPGQQILPPGQIPLHPPEYANPKQLQGALLPSNVNPILQNKLIENTLNRGQSQKIPYGPGFIIVGRDGSQRYESPPKEEKVKGVDGQERTLTYNEVPSGKFDASGNPLFVKRYMGTEGEGTGGPAPTKPDVEMPDISVSKPAQAEVPQTQTAPAGPGGMLGQPPPAEALGDVMPRAGLDNPAPPATPQAPALPPQAPVPPAPPPAPAAPRPAMAQAAKSAEQLQQEMKQEGLDYDYNKALNQTEAKDFPATQQRLLQKGTQAVDAINQLELMRKASEDKDFQSGAFAPARVEFLRAAAFLFPGLVDPNKTAPNDIWDKLRAGEVLKSLQTNLADQGLGRILQTEVQLLNTTEGSSNNSPAAIRAILDLNQRAAQKMVAAANIAKGYEQGLRIDPKTGTWAMKDGKPIIATKHGSNTDLLANINNWATHPNNQLYNKEQQDKFMEMFKDRTAKPEGEGAKPKRVNPIRQLFSPTPSATPEEALKRKLGQ